MKRIITLLLVALMTGTTEVPAQSFLKKLGKDLENAVKDAAKNKKTNGKPNNQRSNPPKNASRKKTSAEEKRRASDEYRAATEYSKESRKMTLPAKDHLALLEPIGNPITDGTTEFVCPTPPPPTKDLSAWAEKLVPVQKLTNASLIKEVRLLAPLLKRETYIINAMIARHDAANDEFFGRMRVVSGVHVHIEEMYEETEMHSQQWVINSRGDKLVRDLSSDLYKRALNSSIEPFREFMDEATVAYFNSYAKSWADLHKQRSKWVPYPEDETVSAADKALAAKGDGTVAATLNPDGVSVTHEHMTFTFMKTYLKLSSTYKPGLEGKDVVIPGKIAVKGKVYPVKEISPGAFAGCGAKSIVIPNTVTTLYREAFSRLLYVKTITIPASVKQIDAHCFAGCKELTEIHLPNSITLLDGYAFADCPKLTTVILPKNVKSLRDNMFNNCPMLKNVTLPENITKLGNNFFASCKSLASIQLPKTLKTIGRNTFAGCSALTAIELPAGLTTIGDNAFANCRKLTSLRIPASVTEIGDDIVEECPSLKSITLSPAYKDFSTLYDLFRTSGFFKDADLMAKKIPSAFRFEGSE